MKIIIDFAKETDYMMLGYLLISKTFSEAVLSVMHIKSEFTLCQKDEVISKHIKSDNCYTNGLWTMAYDNKGNIIFKTEDYYLLNGFGESEDWERIDYEVKK